MRLVAIMASFVFVGSAAFAAEEDAGNYLDAVEKIGLVRWSPDAMPIKVYVKDGSVVKNFRPDMVTVLRRAFAEWSLATKGRIRFTFVTDPSAAQIECSWSDDPKSLPIRGELGHAMPMIEEHDISRADIVL